MNSPDAPSNDWGDNPTYKFTFVYYEDRDLHAAEMERLVDPETLEPCEEYPSPIKDAMFPDEPRTFRFDSEQYVITVTPSELLDVLDHLETLSHDEDDGPFYRAHNNLARWLNKNGSNCSPEYTNQDVDAYFASTCITATLLKCINEDRATVEQLCTACHIMEDHDRVDMAYTIIS